MITTVAGNPVTFIPVVLREGEESLPVTLRVTPEGEGKSLTAEAATEVSLWAKIGAGDYQELAVEPLDLSAYFPGFVDVEVKAVAAENVPGVVRKYIYLGILSGSAAAWEV